MAAGKHMASEYMETSGSWFESRYWAVGVESRWRKRERNAEREKKRRKKKSREAETNTETETNTRSKTYDYSDTCERLRQSRTRKAI